MGALIVDRDMAAGLIPQRDPIVMVHGLLSHSDACSEAVLLVEKDNLFVRDGLLLPSGLMEHIAQSAALRTGYQFSRMAGSGPAHAPVGFIGALKDFRVLRLPSVGERLITRVTPMHEVGRMSVILGEVFADDALIASCEMKVFLKEG